MVTSLKPKNFKEFIGQEKLKKTLKTIIFSSKVQNISIDHILFYGPSGMGKTTLAFLIANAIKKPIKVIQGVSLEKKSDILSLFASIEEKQIIFIDEIHGINKCIEEILYSALDSKTINLIIGPENEMKVVNFKLPSFTLIGATTKINKISLPLRNRFGILAKITNYNVEELQKILFNSAKRLKWPIEERALEKIANHSRLVPRVANNILKRCIDFSIAKGKKIIDYKTTNETLRTLGLYFYGLNENQVSYLKMLKDDFKCKYISLDTISNSFGENREVVEQEIEPILIAKSLIKKSTRGRKITTKGEKYLLDL